MLHLLTVCCKTPFGHSSSFRLRVNSQQNYDQNQSQKRFNLRSFYQVLLMQYQFREISLTLSFRVYSKPVHARACSIINHLLFRILMIVYVFSSVICFLLTTYITDACYSKCNSCEENLLLIRFHSYFLYHLDQKDFV